MQAEEILAMTVVLLKATLSELSLPTSGKKQELRDRLLKHFNLVNDEDDEESEDQGGNSGDESFHSGGGEDLSCAGVRESFSHFTLKDVKDSLNNFSGTDSPKVVDWVREFEETASTVSWNELQKFVYAKQLLRGAAMSFVRGQNIRDWTSLKKKLLLEFSSTVSAIEVHNSLKRRRKKTDESLREYLYALIEIGKPISLDEASTLRYFADGVLDSRSNKTILYQARTMGELKEAIKVYEAVNKDNNQQGKGPTKTMKESRKCFKCGEASHIAKDCKSTSVKCFKCNQLGHKSFECSKNKSSENQSKLNAMHREQKGRDSKLIFKTIKMNNMEMSAFIDTGCDVNLMRYDTLMKVGDVDLAAEHIVMCGAKDSMFSTIGSFSSELKVDEVSCRVKFHVVRERDLKFPVVIGSEMLKHVDIIFTEEGAKFLSKGIGRAAQSHETPVNNTTDNNMDIRHTFQAMCSLSEEMQAKTVDLKLEHLPFKEAKIIQEMVDGYAPKKVEKSPVEMKIVLTDEIPVYQLARRISPADKKTVEQQVDKWLDEGIIQTSTSEYATLVVLVNN